MSISVKKPRSSNKVNMCEGKIMPLLLRFAVPLLITGVLQVLFNAADIIVVGKFAANSDHSLAAVGATTSLVALIVNLFIGLSIGTNVLCARFFGAKEYDNLSKTVHTSMFVSVIMGVFLTLFGFFGAEMFTAIMSVPADIAPLSTLYMRIYFLGMVPMLIYNFASAILRSVGDTKRPMYFLTIAGVINVLLNLLLVIVFHLDVAGVAIATVTAQTVSAILTVRCLLKDDGAIKLCLKKLRCSKQHFAQIVRIGLPAGLQSTMFSIANVIIQSSLNALDVEAGGEGFIVAGCSAAASIESIIFTAMDSVYQAVVSFTSQNFGVRDYGRIKKAQVRGLILIGILCLVLCSMCFIIPEQLVSIYADKDSLQTIAVGAERLALVGGTCFLVGFSNIFVSGMRGMGYSVTPMIISLICVCGSRLLWLATAFRIDRSIYTLYMAYPVSYVLTFVAQAIAVLIVFRLAVKKYPPIQQL